MAYLPRQRVLSKRRCPQHWNPEWEGASNPSRPAWDDSIDCSFGKKQQFSQPHRPARRHVTAARGKMLLSECDATQQRASARIRTSLFAIIVDNSRPGAATISNAPISAIHRVPDMTCSKERLFHGRCHLLVCAVEAPNSSRKGPHKRMTR